MAQPTIGMLKVGITRIEKKINKSTSIRDLVFSEAYDGVVKLSCPLLPRDCQIEIINMLSPAPLSSSFILKQSSAEVQVNGFIVKLLPEAKQVNQLSTGYPYTSIQQELYHILQLFQFGLSQYRSRLFILFHLCFWI